MLFRFPTPGMERNLMPQRGGLESVSAIVLGEPANVPEQIRRYGVAGMAGTAGQS
jgi:hypothetical protein